MAALRRCSSIIVNRNEALASLATALAGPRAHRRLLSSRERGESDSVPTHPPRPSVETAGGQPSPPPTHVEQGLFSRLGRAVSAFSSMVGWSGTRETGHVASERSAKDGTSGAPNAVGWWDDVDADVARRRRLILDGDAMPRAVQYRHHILGAMRESVPNVSEAAAWLVAMASENLAIDPTEAAHVLDACIRSESSGSNNHTSMRSAPATSTPQVGNPAATAACLRAMAAGGLAPTPEALTAALTLLASTRSSPHDAAMAVNLLLAHSDANAAVASWSVPPNNVLSALIVRAEGGDGEWWWTGASGDSKDDASRLVSALGSAGGPLPRELSMLLVARTIQRCGETKPQRSQLALNLYRGLKQHVKEPIDMKTVYATVVACLGTPHVRDGGGEAANAQAPFRASPSVVLDILAENHHGDRLNEDYMYAAAMVKGVSVDVQASVLRLCVLAATHEVVTIEGKTWNEKTLTRIVPILPLANVLVSACDHIDHSMISVFHVVLLALRAYRGSYQRWFLRRLEPKIVLPDESPHLVPPGTTPEELAAWRDDLSKIFGLIITSYAELARKSDNDTSARPYYVPVQEPSRRALAVLERMEASGPLPNEFHYSAAIDACANHQPHPLVSDAIAVLERMLERPDVPPCGPAWGGLLKALANARPARSDEAIHVLTRMLTHAKCPVPTSQHYHSVVLACLADNPPRVAQAARLLATAPDWLRWPSNGKTFDIVLRAVANAVEEGVVLTLDAGHKSRSDPIVSLPLLARMIRDGYAVKKHHYIAALAEIASHKLAGSRAGVDVLRMMVGAGFWPDRDMCMGVLGWCFTASDAEEVLEIMKGAGHAINWDDPAHLFMLKAYHRSEPPALESAVEHLLGVIDSKPEGKALDPALFQAVMRSCVKTKPARLDAALKLLDLMLDQGISPNIPTLTLLLQCCHLARPSDPARAVALWRAHGPPPQTIEGRSGEHRLDRFDKARLREAITELELAVGKEKADALISGRSSRGKSAAE